MKLEDPVAPYRVIMAEYRRTRPAPDTDIFRFEGHAPTRHLRPSNGPIAVVGASDWALDPIRAEKTFAHIGMLGGLLADFGYDVYSLGSLAVLDRRPAFIGWVGGDESESEQAQLEALDMPGLVIGPSVEGVASLGNVEPEGHRDSIELVRAALDEIRRLTDSDGLPGTASPGGSPSTVSSTVRPGTGVYRTARPGYDLPTTPSSRARSGTGWDRTKRRSEGS